MIITITAILALIIGFSFGFITMLVIVAPDRCDEDNYTEFYEPEDYDV